MGTRTLLLITFFLLATWVQGVAQPKVPDSPQYLIPLIEKSKPDTSRISLLHRLGSYYVYKYGNYNYDLDSGQHCFNTALQLSERLHTQAWTNELLMMKGNCYLEANDLKRGGQCFQQVVDYFHRTNNSAEEIKTWERWGNCIFFSYYEEKAACYTGALQVRNITEAARADYLFLIASCYYNKPDHDREFMEKALRYADSGLLISQRFHRDSIQNEFLLLKANSFFQLRDPLKGKSYFKQATDNYHRSGQKNTEARKYVYMGMGLPGEFATERIDYLSTGRTLLQQLPARDKEFETDALKLMADIHLTQGKLDLAETELKQVLVDYKAIGFKNLWYTYDLLGEVYNKKGEPEKMLSCFLECIKDPSGIRDSYGPAYMCIKIGNCYDQLGFDEKSLFYFDKALAYPLNGYYDTAVHYRGVHQRTDLLIRKGRAAEALQLLQNEKKNGWPTAFEMVRNLDESYGNCYKALGEFDKAEKYYLDLERRANDLPNHGGNRLQKLISFKMAGLYASMKEYKKAHVYLKQMDTIPYGMFSPADQSWIHFIRFQVDSALGNNTSAIREYELYTAMKDSIFNTTKNKQIQELEISYETKQKEQDISDLKSKEKIQQAELKRTNAQRNLILIAGVLMLIIAALAYIGFRQKRRSNLLLQVHQQEIDAKNESLEKLNHKQALLLREKEWLVREIHHRVKNNLQTTISLLHMQSSYLSNEEALTAIRNSQRRMQAMSLIHQRLYQSEDMTNIEMAAYIAELVNFLRESFRGIGNISFEVQTEQAIFDVSLAVPLGLIINEGVTNAIKYAFPDNRLGKITVSLKKDAGGIFTLSIADNGVGIPSSIDFPDRQDSLGLNLIRGLTDQVQGELNIIDNNGTTLQILFNPDLLSSPPTVS